MLTLEKRISALSALGETMVRGAAGETGGASALFSGLIESLEKQNPWFTPENVRLAVTNSGKMISDDNLKKWVSVYPGLDKEHRPARIGVVMAGNIPLVGFHDFISVLISGNIINGKLSSKDELLMKAVASALIRIEPEFADFIDLTTGKITDFEGVIATGSDNTSRYFEYYFREYPSVIRHNRNSIAILDGSESAGELNMLGKDVFMYFGLGCRNISKLYLPEGYNPESFYDYWKEYDNLRSHHKYAVNYDHNKAVMIVNRQPFTDTGFVLIKNDRSLTPPIAVLNYEFYSSSERLNADLSLISERIQCIAGHGHLPFGKSQEPNLWDYADETDTINFLVKNFSH